MVYIRGSRHDYDQWETEGADGWSYTDVLPYFMKIEDMKIKQLTNSSKYHHTFVKKFPSFSLFIKIVNNSFRKKACN